MNFLFLETIGYESALRLSGHHYARLLARSGHRVVSLSAPVSPFHAFAKSNRAAVSRRMEQHRAGFIPAPPEKPAEILHYVPKTLIPVTATFPMDQPWALSLSARSFQSDVLRRLEALDFVPDVVSLHSLIFYPLARHFQNRANAILHYRIEDLLEGFADIPKSFLYFEKKVIDEADVVSITAENLGFKVTEKNASKLIFTPNGVDEEHFAVPRPRPREYENITKPIALYVGALRAWFDWNLLEQAADALPDIQFVLISPDPPREGFLGRPNAAYIPGVTYEEIPAYVQHAAVGLIPFQSSPLIQAVSPIKLFEYLASRIPVVSVEWEALANLRAPITAARTSEQFISGIRCAIGEQGTRDYTDFVAQHSWQKNLDLLIERIADLRKTQ